MSNERLFPSKALRERYGVSSMTLWRWVRAGILPSPIQINGRNYWPESAAAVATAAKGSKAGAV